MKNVWMIYFWVKFVKELSCYQQMCHKRDSAGDWLSWTDRSREISVVMVRQERNGVNTECFYLPVSTSAIVWWVYSMCGWNWFFFFFFEAMYFFLNFLTVKKDLCPSVLGFTWRCVLPTCTMSPCVSFSEINFYICAKIFMTPEPFVINDLLFAYNAFF